MSTLTLDALPGYRPFAGPVVLVIMDGVGLGRRDESDGVFLANTPVLDELLAEPLFVRLKAHGKAVGLPSDDDMGNSEVGHNALGAGRVFAQGAQLVNDAIESGDDLPRRRVAGRRRRGRRRAARSTSSACCRTATSTATSATCSRCSTAAPKKACARVRVHALLDGRDVGERSALTYLDALEAELSRLERGRRARLPDRVGRRPDGHDDGPLRRRLVRGRAGLEGARAGRRPAVRVGARGGGDLLPGGPREHRPVPAELRRRRGRRGRSARSRTATPSSSSTSAATGRSRSRGRSRSGTSSEFDRVRVPDVVLRRA